MSLGLCLCFIYMAFGLKVMLFLSFFSLLLVTGYPWIAFLSDSFFFTLLLLDGMLLLVSWAERVFKSLNMFLF